MGLFNTTYVNRTENTTHVTESPERVDVHEHRAPTDESIRLMEEMHDKAFKNIIAKVKVEDNLVNGEIFVMEQPWNYKQDLRFVVKFKINNHEFLVDKQVSRQEVMYDKELPFAPFAERIKDYGKQYMAWFALKMVSKELLEQVIGQKVNIDI